MNRSFYIFIFLFIIMILVNESYRNKIVEKRNVNYGLKTINSRIANKNKCSWECYYNTSYCKQNHVKFLSPYFDYIDPVYYGTIRQLNRGAGYVVSNIIYLVILWPFLILSLFYKNISFRNQIIKLKK